MRAPKTRLALVLMLAAGAACSSEDKGAIFVAESVFVLPASLDALNGKTFFDHPFPSDLRRDPDGSARFTGWPNPGNVPLLTEFLRVTPGMFRGFSPVAAIHLRFSSPIDASSLPASPPETGNASSVVQLVDVDPASPERGKRRLVTTLVKGEASESSYWSSYTLAMMPILGQPLRPATRYAAVVTRSAKAVGGGEVRPDAVLAEVLGEVPPTGATLAARDLFGPAIAELESAGLPKSQIAHMTVFTTDDPTREAFAVMDDVVKNVSAPTASAWTLVNEGTDFDVYEGSYGPSPNYQSGAVPYRKTDDGGGFLFDGDVPRLQNTFDVRFALTVPRADKCPLPASGHPIVLYAHGTGGNYRSFISDGTARALGQKCLATMGVDQIFHGTRPGSPPESDPARNTTIQFLFFNFDNPLAARTNGRQSGVDVLQQARLFTETRAKVPAAVSATKQDIAFDPSKLTFFGHSQGGLNGPIFLAGSDAARGAVLSGAGSVLAVALLEKTKPVDIPAALKFLVCGSDTECADELGVFHPAITLAQSIVDATDPVHYARFITTTPRPGMRPKSIYQTVGVNPDGSGDTYAPPRGIHAFSVAMRLPRLAPGVRAIEESAWLGLEDVTVPADGLTGNIGGGEATGALAQFSPPGNEDGHFVIFDVPEARAQSSQFLRALSDDPKGRISAP